MYDNLPFRYCNDDELESVLSIERKRDRPRYETMARDLIPEKQLPFYNCTDYVMLTECLTNKDKFLELFENNAFISECHSLINGLLMENYSCRYYNEDSFNSMLPKHQKNSLKSFHLNIRSLNKHCHELYTFLSCLNCDFDIILLTEIGKTDKQLIEKAFENYTLYFDHPNSNKGGAGILIKNGRFDEIEISDNKINLNCNCSNCIVESIFLDLKFKNKTLTVGSIYRHPNGKVSHFNESLDQCIKEYNTNSMLLIGGDINIDLLKTNIPMTQNYIDTMLSHNLIPSITIPTRFTERTTTLIDHIFVRLPQTKINNMVTSGNLITDISDHLSNFSIIDIDIRTTKERPYIRLYNKKKY